MLGREKAVELIQNQFDFQYETEQKAAWHYGKMELRALLDAIYGGPPANQTEKLE